MRSRYFLSGTSPLGDTFLADSTWQGHNKGGIEEHGAMKRLPPRPRWRAMFDALEALSEAALLFAVIFVMTAIGLAVARRYRDRAAKDIAESSAMMSKFRELHAEGGLSDEEFRTIKTKLASELKAELNDNSSTG